MPDQIPFISYAQHGEDVILWRALGGRDQVRYVDVGGYHPTDDSVTRALYERGWRGVNIEALPERIEAFEVARPEDINVAVAIGDHDGTAVLTVPQTPGWETIREPEGAPAADDAHSGVRRVEVPLRTLATLLPELLVDRVDVLKIDVEGAEPAVVRGLLKGDVRPTVCVVEGTSPTFGREAGDEAVGLLTAAGYRHTMFDGLNHYLTIDADLVPALSVPASPADGYVTFRFQRLAEENARLRAAQGASSGQARLDPLTMGERPPQEALAAVYKAVLGRDPDARGLADWSSHLTDAGSWLTVAELMAGSDESLRRPAEERAEVERVLLAGRLARGLAEIGPHVRRRGPYSEGLAAREIFVEALYEVTLGREPTAEEREHDVARLGGGLTRGKIVREYAGRPGAAERLLGAAPKGRAARLATRLQPPDPLPVARARIRAAEARRVAGLAFAYLDAISDTGPGDH